MQLIWLRACRRMPNLGRFVVSNIVYQSMSPSIQSLLHETEPIEAKNVGRIKAWTFDQTDHGAA